MPKFSNREQSIIKKTVALLHTDIYIHKYLPKCSNRVLTLHFQNYTFSVQPGVVFSGFKNLCNFTNRVRLRVNFRNKIGHPTQMRGLADTFLFHYYPITLT